MLVALLVAAAFTVNPDAGNNTFTATFDAPLGERINAVSSAVSCKLTVDDKANTASGTCSVPLTSIMVDNEPTKTEHFQQWATNKKGKPKACKFEATLTDIPLGGPLSAVKPTTFAADVPFTICGRAREDGGKERVEGTAVVLPSEPGQPRALRISAHVEKFNRESYRVGPGFTDGWLARVQSLAPVVAKEGRIELTLRAREEGDAQAQPGSSKSPKSKK